MPSFPLDLVREVVMSGLEHAVSVNQVKINCFRFLKRSENNLIFLRQSKSGFNK